MGQYYLIVAVDPEVEKYIVPPKFGSGYKLGELTYDAKVGVTAALMILLSDGNGRGGGDLNVDDRIAGRWAGKRIVVAGDYADDCKFLSEEQLFRFYEKYPEAMEKVKRFGRIGPNLHEVARVLFRDISEEVLAAMLGDDSLRETLVERYFDEFRILSAYAYDSPFVKAFREAFMLRGEILPEVAF